MRKEKEKSRYIFCRIEKNVLHVAVTCLPRFRKNSALRVSFLFLYTHDNENK